MLKKIKPTFPIFYLIALFTFTLYLLIDTFYLQKTYQIVNQPSNTSSHNQSELETNPIITNNSYKDSNIEITIHKYREYNTNIYVANITLNSADYLKTAFANNTYGKNITAKTSEIAQAHNAILAINGDYYGVQEKGFVLKNGVIYRTTPKNNREDLLIYKNGTFKIITENDTTDLEALINENVYNLLSFGPSLLINNEITITPNEEVDKAKTSNPRTAIGIIDKLNYIFIVSDGRTNESTGLSLYELATFAKNLKVDVLYNLDGGGSSTMYFNGQIINNPTSTGRKIKERSVSDIVYIGY